MRFVHIYKIFDEDKDKWFLWLFITAKVLQSQDWGNFSFIGV